MTLLSVRWSFVYRKALKLRSSFITTIITKQVLVKRWVRTFICTLIHSCKFTQSSAFLSFQLPSSCIHFYKLTCFFWDWKDMDQLRRKKTWRKYNAEKTVFSTREKISIRWHPKVPSSLACTCKIFNYVASGLAKHSLQTISMVTWKLYVLISKFWH